MQKPKQFSIAALVILSLFFTASFTAADITGGDTKINITTGGPVTGNSDSTNITDLSDSSIVPTDDSAVYANRVTIESNGNVSGEVYGGITNGDGAVYENTVTIENGGHGYRVYGGWAGAGDATGNAVSITDSGRANVVYGGWANGAGDATGNTVSITDSGRANVVYGGWADGAGDATGNAVSITDSGAYRVYGGYANGAGDATGNAVSITDTDSGRADFVYGGWANGAGDAASNTVSITSGGSAYQVSGGWANGAGDATGNAVSITDSGRADFVCGGWAGAGDATGNAVSITDSGRAGAVYGGYTYGAGDATGNAVSITDSGRADTVYGGWASGSGEVSNNIVTISGTVNNGVYAGYTLGSGTVIDNIVNITGTAILTNASIYGSNTSSVAGTGNTLNVNGFCGSMVTMGNFENYNFILGKLNNLTFIEISGNAVDIDDSNITISFAPEFMTNVLNAGDVITVISDITTITGPNSITVLSSSFIAYDYTASYGTALLLTINSMAPQPQTKALGEAFAAGLAFLGQAADLRSGLDLLSEGSGFIPFAKMVYGNQYITTGSSVQVKGFSAIAGLALNTNFDNGSQLVVGAFIEGGWGDYDSRNSFKNSAAIKGRGDTEYYGGGLLARYAMTSGLYGEGTFAAGKTETDFRSWGFTPGTRTKYDYSVPYYSANLTVGQVLSLGNLLNLDVYGKYLWTRQAGDNVTVDGYRFKFKDADSHRLRAGGKLKADVSPQLQPYVGAAYEYEFSGKIKGSLYGMNLEQPSLRGGTGIGELGLAWSPTESGSFKVDLGMQGYAGKREGMSGGLTVSLSF